MVEPSDLASVPSPRWPRLGAVLFSIAAVAIASMAAVTVYFKSFTGFSVWDDEGYVMIGLRSFLQGKALYDYVFSQYGPFYYLVQASIYTVLDLPVTHNAVRAIVASFWLLTAVLCAWAVHRLTRSWILTALGFTGAIRILQFFVGSPGHPEELCIALLMGILVAACYFSDRATVWRACVLGSLVAALALTKINIGCYAALALALAMLKAMPPGPRQKAGFAFLFIGGLSLPIVILSPILHQAWAPRAVIFLILSMSAAVLVAWCSESEQLATPALWAAMIVAAGVVAVIIVALVVVRGTTLLPMLNMTVLQHKDTARNWYAPLRVGRESVAVLSLLLAVAWVKLSAISSARKPMILALTILKIVICALFVLYLARGGWPALYNLAVPWSWLLLVPPTEDASKKSEFARVALCLLGAFAALYPLPVAGAQGPFSLMPVIPALCVFLNDGRIMLVRFLPWPKLMRMVEVAALVFMLTTNAFWVREAAQRYRLLTPLSIAGSERIHLRAEQAASYEGVTAVLKNSCEFNFSMPGMFSFYIWTNSTPPTGMLMNNWIGLLTQDQQRKIITDLSNRPRLCIIYHSGLVGFWRRGQDVSASPLVRYIQDGFQRSMQVGDYVILVRKR